MSILNNERLVERAVLIYALMFVALLTLSPMDFAWPSEWRVMWWSDWPDVPANILFFVPIGYLFVLALASEQRRPVWAAAVFGTLLSACLESGQLFVAVRHRSTRQRRGRDTWRLTVYRRARPLEASVSGCADLGSSLRTLVKIIFTFGRP